MLLEQVIYTFPELALIAGIIHLCALHIMSYKSAKVYAFTTRFWVLISCFLSVIFYNQSINAQYFSNNAYTLFFILWNNLFIYILLSASASWFATENHTGCLYNILILASVLVANILITTINLGILLTGLTALVFINYILIQLYSDKKYSKYKKYYLRVSLFIILLSAIGCSFLYTANGNNLSYHSLLKLYQQYPNSIPLYAALMSVILFILYLLNIAPFHIMSEENKCYSVLPITHYFAAVFPIMLWATLIKLMRDLYSGYTPELAFSYKIFAFISIIIGAVGANVRINLHRIYAQNSIYHFGIVLLLLSILTKEAEFSALIYLVAYLLSLNTAYIICYNIKSHGTYQSTVTSLAGLAQTRPYTTAAMMLCLFSFIGIPPLIGFLGQMNLVRELLNQNLYYILGFVFCFWLILSKSYLEIIKTIYFDKKITILDKEDNYLLLLTILSITAMIVLTLNPFNFMETIKDLFDVIFL